MDDLTRERYADWDQPRPKRKLPRADWKVIEDRRRVLDEALHSNVNKQPGGEP